MNYYVAHWNVANAAIADGRADADGVFFGISFGLPDVLCGFGLAWADCAALLFFVSRFALPDVLIWVTMSNALSYAGIALVRPGACNGCRAVWGWVRASGGGDHAPPRAAAPVRAARLFVPRPQRQQLREVGGIMLPKECSHYHAWSCSEDHREVGGMWREAGGGLGLGMENDCALV